MTTVKRQDHSLFVKYTYNALGWRTSAVWDIDSANGDLNDETLEEYRYDEQWRLIAILRRASAYEVTPVPLRPPGILYQRFVYHNDGLNGYGSGSSGARGLDLPLYRERDTDLDGDIDERVWYLSNHHHDVVGLAVQTGAGRRLVERIRYSPFGVPTCYPAADITMDGWVDSVDQDLYNEAYYATNPPVSDWRLDIDQDGDRDGTDLSLFFDELNTLYGYDGHGQVTATLDNRIGYAGYTYDPYVGIYFVRHRAYDAQHGRWLQRDPAMYHDGMNLYAYCGNDPIGFIDPMGLYWEQTATQLANSGNVVKGALGYALGVAGGYAEGAVDGAAIVANQLTFKQIDEIDEHSRNLRADNGWTYEASDWAGAVAREAAIMAATLGVSAVARGGIAGAGAIPQALTALARYRSAVQAARYVTAAMTVWDVASGSYKVGNGIYAVFWEGDPSGWWDIALGGVRVGGGFLGAKDLKYFPDRPLQDHHSIPKTAKLAEPARAIAKKLGLDIDGDWNMIMLPHWGGHPIRYLKWVNRITQLLYKKSGGDAETFLELFDEYVKEPIRRDPNLLRKCGWE